MDADAGIKQRSDEGIGSQPACGGCHNQRLGGAVAWTRFAEVRALLHCVGSDVLSIYLGASYADDVLDCCLMAKGRA